MRLTLHIGTEKTGTTSLQSWFATNREALRKQGVHYPTSLGQLMHRDLSIFARDADKPDDGFQDRNITSPEQHEAFCRQLLGAFTQEYKEFARVPHWFVSSEHLHSRLTTVGMVERVKSFFGDRFETVEIIAHLRPQIDVAVSLASTATRVGLKVGAKWFSAKRPSDAYYNYDLLVRRWEHIFGAQAVLVVPFKRQPNLTDLLIKRLDLEVAPLAPAQRKNESLDWRSIALVNAILAHEPVRPAESLFLDDWPMRERIEVGPDVARRFQAVFEASNEALVARRHELTSDDLTPDWSAYQAPSNLALLESAGPFGEQLGYMVARLNGELMLERCARLLTEVELAVAQGGANAAGEHLERAKTLIGRVPEIAATSTRLAELRWRISELQRHVQDQVRPTGAAPN